MRLTTKGRFAVTAMIDLALRQNNGPVTLAAISQRQQISLSYLEQLFGKLRRHELVESTRGPGGGYQLVVSLDQLSVWDVVLCFNPKNTSLPKNHSSPESRATNFIAENAEQFEKEFLQNYPLAQLVPPNAVLSDSKPTKSLAMNFKPLPIRARPAAPNSIFDLSNFLNLQAA